MGNLLGQMMLGLLKSLITKRFMARIAVELFWYLSQKTEATWDDNGVRAMADEWGVDMPEST